MQDYQGKRVLITGGTQGLGRALSFALGRAGAHVAFVARNRDDVNRTEEELRKSNIAALGITSDIGHHTASLSIAAQAHEYLGHVDLLIHNASTLGPLPLRPLANLTSEDFARVLQVNLLGPHSLTRAIGGNMLLRSSSASSVSHRPTIVTISSDAAVETYPDWGAYSVAKAGLDHLTRIWAAETEASDLHFISIDPGEMNTKMHADAIPEADPNTLATPQSVAEAIMTLLCDPSIVSGCRVEANAWRSAA